MNVHEIELLEHSRMCAAQQRAIDKVQRQRAEVSSELEGVTNATLHGTVRLGGQH
jgi:hypothetical protein